MLLAQNKQFRRLKSVTGQNNIKYMGCAWSSPNWMKPNNTWSGLSHLLPEYYDTWAEYHVRLVLINVMISFLRIFNQV